MFRPTPSFSDDTADRWPLLPVVAVWLAAWLVLTWPWTTGRVTVPWDAKAHFLPQVQFLAQSIARGEWPFWAPYVFAGQPQIADPQSMLWSPPILLLALLHPSPGGYAMDLAVHAAIFVSGVAMLAWFRDRGWHWAGGLVAAIAFGFGAAMAWRIQHVGQVLSLAYLPLALFTLERALARRSLLWGALAGAVGAAIVLGRDQVALLVLYLLVARVLVHWLAPGERWPRFRASFAPLGAGTLVGLALVALPLLLTFALAEQSNRPSIDLEGAGRGSLHPALLLTSLAADIFGSAGRRMEDFWGPPSYYWEGTGLFVAQNMGVVYVGALPLLLVVTAALQGRLWEREVRFFTLAAVAVLLYALGWYTPFFRAAHAVLPGVALFRRPADAVFLLGGLTAILAGYATHRLFAEPWSAPSRRLLGVAGALLGAGFLAMFGLAWSFGRLEQSAVPLASALLALGASALAIAWARARVTLDPRLAAAALLALVVADLARHNGPNGATALPPRYYEVLEPASKNATVALLRNSVAASRSETRRDRVELLGLGFHWPNASLTHGLENTLGYNPVRLGLYSRATGAEDHVGLPGQRKLSPLFPAYASPLADMLGLRWIASGVALAEIDPRHTLRELPLVARTRDAFIYENPRALPRVLLVGEARAADFERLLADGRWPAGFDPRRTVLLEAGEMALVPPALQAGAEGGDVAARAAPADVAAIRRPASVPGTARIVAYRNTEVVLESESAAGGILLLNDVWQRWWTVEVDGRPAPMLRANVLFRAVVVPAGKVRIRFVFRPVAGALADTWARLAGRGEKALPAQAPSAKQ
jgi:hypothetical protein